MTSSHRLAGAGREAGIALCFSAAEDPRGAASRSKPTEIKALGQRKSQTKHPSAVPAWRARQALHFRKGGKLERYFMILFLNSTSQCPQWRRMGVLEGQGGAEFQNIRISASPHSSWSNATQAWWDKPGSAMQIPKCQNSPCPWHWTPCPHPGDLQGVASEARERKTWHCRKPESRIRV